MKSAILWSGGKDSYLSLKLAREKGINIAYALSYINQYSKRLLTSYIKEKVVRRQTYLLGLKFIPVYCSKRKNNVLQRLETSLRELIRSGVESLITGNTCDEELRGIIDSLSNKLGIKTLHPLWGYPPERVIGMLRGDKILIVCSKDRRLTGRFLNGDTLRYMRERGAPIGGDGGFYQSFILYGDSYRISPKVYRRGFYRCVEVEI